jgi:hypothetical protein
VQALPAHHSKTLALLKKKPVTIKAAWIGLTGTIAAALIAGIIALSGNDKTSAVPSNTAVGTVNGDLVQGDKVVNQKIDNITYQLPDLSDGKINIVDITEHGGINLQGYKIYQSLKLNKFSNGLNGALLILIDKRLNGIGGELKYDGYLDVSYLDFKADAALNREDTDDLKQALLVVVDERLKVLYHESLGRESARLDRAFIYTDKSRPTYILTRDYSIGFGSYNGPISYFLEVNQNGIQYILNKEGFMTSLKSGWLIKHAGGESEILYKKCRPKVLNEDGDVEFIIYYEKYKLENRSWKATLRQKKDFWEYYEGLEKFGLEDFYTTIGNK